MVKKKSFLLTDPITDCMCLRRHGATITPQKCCCKKLDDKLKTKGLNNPAIVLNSIKEKRFGKYGYGYRYGYGYTENSVKKRW